MTTHSTRLLLVAALLASATLPAQAPKKRNVILFVADGLRRGSVTAEDMPTLFRLRTQGVDFRNSHSVFPTFTTANASAIATGHALGDTGDFSNTIYPGDLVLQPGNQAAGGTLIPFLESDEVLANMNARFDGNYLGETTLLTAARNAGYNTASLGKVGPTGIQIIDQVQWDELGLLKEPATPLVDDFTGTPRGLPLSIDLQTSIENAGLASVAPSRSNGHAETSPWNNGFAGSATVAGTRAANVTQQTWLNDLATTVLLPHFAADTKPFVLLFWSRDPDATQHTEGDSLQTLSPGINGETSRRALHNADRSLKALLDWLDAHPDVKANTDVLITSDHGFATVSRRELSREGTLTAEPSAHMDYAVDAHEGQEPRGTLPSGFLAIDLALWSHTRLFDPAIRATSGPSVYAEVKLGGDLSQHPASGSALLGDQVTRLDGTDARLIVAANGGSDLIYVPSRSATIVHETLATLMGLDYVGGVFVDDAFCATPKDCPGALPLSAISLKGSTHLPTPAIVVAFKVFYSEAANLQTARQISDTMFQEGQGMHGGFGRDSTWNNMAAIGPDFKHGFVDEAPAGNMDIAPTVAAILGLTIKSHGSLKGRALSEAMSTAPAPAEPKPLHELSPAASNGHHTLLEYQVHSGVRYYDRACIVTDDKTTACPQ